MPKNKIYTYLDKNEIEQIKEFAKTNNLSFSCATRTIIKLQFYKYSPKNIYFKNSPDAQEIIRQQLRLGNNLNQATHGINILVNADKMTKQEVQLLLSSEEDLKKFLNEYPIYIQEFQKRLL